MGDEMTGTKPLPRWLDGDDAALEEARQLAQLPVQAFRTTKQALTAETVRRMRSLLAEDLALVDRIGA